MKTTVRRLKLTIREALGDEEKKSEYGGEGPFELPDDHVAGVKVPKGGSSCASCRYGEAKDDGPHCTNTYWVAWNGGESRLPVDDPETYCSDWWEEKK